MADDDGSVLPTFMRDLPLARAALEYARDLHGDQRRDSDRAPFILHPLEVAAMLSNTGHAEPVVTAGVLHDTVEDAGADIGEIRARFGDDVASLVDALTEDGSIDAYEERKAGLRRQIAEAGRDASSVYAADKVAKVRELRAQAAAQAEILGEDAIRRKVEHYHRSLETLESIDPEHPLVRQLRFELEALHALPPG